MKLDNQVNKKVHNQAEKMIVKPMYLKESVLWFGFWAIILIINIHVWMPYLLSSDLSEFESFYIVITVPLALMFFSAILIYFLKNNYSMKGFATFYRIRPFKPMDIAWGIGLCFFLMLATAVFSLLGTKLIDIGIIRIPKSLPLILSPDTSFDYHSLNIIVGGQIVGNWKVIILYFVMLFFNVAGEELLWRGYLLPRQELAFGNKAWIIHGLLWTLFHSFKWWDLISLFPVCLLISFVAQKRKSIWPGFIAHYLFNGMGFFLFLAAALGMLR